MTFADIFSAAVKLRRILVVVSILSGLGCKYGPTAWHKFSPAPGPVAAKQAPVMISGMATVATNAVVVKSPHDLGELTLTNHYETCVHLGGGKDCLVTPRMIDSHNIELTLALETRAPGGKVHDLTVTQVTARSGRPMEVAVGNFQFSMTPKLAE
jgi:hypothetical protein